MKIEREHYFHFWYFIIAILAIVWIQQILYQPGNVKTIPYSEFQQLVEQGKIADAVVGPDQITGTLKDTRPAGDTQASDSKSAASQPQHFVTQRVSPDMAQYLASKGVTFTGQPGPGLFMTILGWLMPSVGFLLIWMLLVRRMAGGGAGGLMAVGKSKAKVFVENEVKVRFDDVAGVDEAKDELKEIVAFLKNPDEYGRLGARIPKGVLLVGPPGTGKTLLARAVAGEAGVPFFSISGSEFVEMFVGVGAARVRDLFEQAMEQAPAIIFIDELDSLGRARGAFLPTGGHDEKEQTLNQLLAEMDGFDPKSGVVLLAATNRPEILDPALLRAGRFDRQILVDRPDRKGRIDILNIHVRKVRLAENVKVEEIAAMTPGFTGADLANLVNEAALLATRRNAENVSQADFSDAIERIVAGLEKRNRLLNRHEREVVAHHEMGHAIVAMTLPNVDPVQKVSIIPRGIGALGYTIQRPVEDRFLMERSELANRMTVLLGGRAAESLIFREISTGAADDLMRATDIARSMVVRFGMDPVLGQVAYEPEQSRLMTPPTQLDFQPRRYGDATADAIDNAVRNLVEAAFTRARDILAENQGLLRQSAAALLAHETLGRAELDGIKEAAHLPATMAGAGPVGEKLLSTG